MNLLTTVVANVLATFDPPDPGPYPMRPGLMHLYKSVFIEPLEPTGVSPLYWLVMALLGVATWFAFRRPT